jgi:hypothetical protein
MKCVHAMLSAALTTTPAVVTAQTFPAPSVELKKNDIFIAAVQSSEKEAGQAPFTQWLGSNGVSVTAGHSWTDHVRMDVTLTLPAPASANAILDTGPDSQGTFVYRDDYWTVRRTTLAVAGVYQFRHNAWVHPYMAGGVDISVERWSGQEHKQTFVRTLDGSVIVNIRTSDTLVPLAPSRHTMVLPVGILGVKVYLTQRWYSRGEICVLGAGGFDRVVWRGGVGFDF